MSEFNLTGFATYANRIVLPELISNIYDRCVFLDILKARGGGATPLRVGNRQIIGGGNLPKARRREIASGGTLIHVRLQTGKVTGSTKRMGARDTGPNIADKTTNSHDQKVKTASFNGSKTHTEVFVWNTTLEKAGSSTTKIANAISEATQIAMEDHLDDICEQLYIGSPTDQEDELWDSMVGVFYAIDDSGVYGNMDRATHSYWQAKRVTEERTASVDLIDEANITLGIKRRGKGIDVLLCAEAPYRTIKAEALSRNGTLIHSGTPDAARLGIRHEAIMYGDCMITYDPWMKDYGGADPDLSGAVMGLTIGDWIYMTDRNANCNMTRFVDQEESVEGGKDGKRAILKTHPKFWCERPFNQVFFEDVV